MPGKKLTKVIWSERSLKNAIEITQYLSETFSQKEIDNFYKILSDFEEAISVFPELYPASDFHKTLRRAVMDKTFSVFYRIGKDNITVVSVLRNSKVH